jgi:hypothetical protein
MRGCCGLLLLFLLAACGHVQAEVKGGERGVRDVTIGFPF